LLPLEQSCHHARPIFAMVNGMRDLLQWVLVFVVLSAVTSVYWKNRATTYRTADGACQSLTIEDECD
jgi:hypothetical protein